MTVTINVSKDVGFLILSDIVNSKVLKENLSKRFYKLLSEPLYKKLDQIKKKISSFYG